ncbi:MAG: regulatory protein RecX [Candidatus Firestonebacteria bacterium]
MLNNSSEKAKNYALNLLSFRNRSEKEIKERLKQKKFDSETTEEVINRLKTVELIDDDKFAKSWIKNRLIGKPRGKNLIKQELYQKGIKKEIIESSINEIYLKETEEELAFKLAQKKAVSYSKLDKTKAKYKLYRFLIGRGFESELIEKTVNKIFQNDRE